METRYFYVLRCALVLTDLILVNFCFSLGAQIANKYGFLAEQNYLRSNLLICNLIWLLCTAIYRLYSDATVHRVEAVYKATARSYVLHIFLFLAFLFMSKQNEFSRNFLVCFYTVMALAFLLSRFLGTYVTTVITKNYDLRKAVAVLGKNEGGQKLASYLLKQNSLKFVGFLDQDYPIINNDGLLEVSSAREQLRTAANYGVEEVFVSVNADKMNDLNDLIEEGEKNCIRLKFVPDFSALEHNFKFDKMDNFTVLCARKEPLESIENRFKKRLFDIVVSLGVIVFIFSWLYPLLAILIKLQSKGPVLFAQLRSGRNNKPFWCYKFRSMAVNKDSDRTQATKNDSRVTPIGRILRKTSLDEFPQFFNVLLGYMSIVGPRPHMIAHTDQYSKIIDKYMVRQFLKPGITGWAQINGYRGETRENWMMEKRVEHDIWYMEHWSLTLDLKIVFMTVINIIKGEKNAY
ncbi:undecaprenyl-phosphate glucose phosphotransferase [Mucilaginibacter sp. RS28]|uniref:Undecaprenyl-phosphate glucose phosphotransferase n=1 Tax=Mucilaginibacter straminoryzae TaxID=2932774 RepID=A0A9X1X4L7_9SPHI|nr:undecaprenyl-phosphate glucose phosphotransferase [Mucilaginibacter straminoryzae]MCJ8211017.1 undecaprenyl-phosphate glucose phosphotransferase [Mucilaginibacter straminoryzae]